MPYNIAYLFWLCNYHVYTCHNHIVIYVYILCDYIFSMSLSWHENNKESESESESTKFQGNISTNNIAIAN